jgi:hypothetical protein
MGRVMRPQFAVHANDDSVKATDLGHDYVDQALVMAHLAALLNVPNGSLQQLATSRLSIPQNAIASLLQGLVLHAAALPQIYISQIQQMQPLHERDRIIRVAKTEF